MEDGRPQPTADGARTLHRQPVAVADVLPAPWTTSACTRGASSIVEESLPPVVPDAVLGARAVNLIINAQRFSPASIPPTVIARAHLGRVDRSGSPIGVRASLAMIGSASSRLSNASATPTPAPAWAWGSPWRGD